MAIPTMPGVKRRKNIGNEIAEMMKGFAQGYRAFGGGDDRQSRADARNPYSDQNLAKYDSRLNSTPLGRMFRGEDDVTGADRGALRLQAKIRAAEEQGDLRTLKQAREDLGELIKMQNSGKIAPSDQPYVMPGTDPNKRVEGVPMPVARPQEFAEAAIDDGMDDGSSNAGSQVAMADPLYNEYGNYQPDYQIFVARGGAIPEMPNRLIGIPMSGIDDNRVLTRPVEESDDDYSIDEPTDNDGPPDSAELLPTDPEELAPYAAEAVDAGYRKLSKDLTSNSALSEEDPDYQARVEGYNAKTQRMTDDEVAELDRMIDPDGTMPTATRGVARMAAAYKFFKDRGEEDRADDVAARLIQYNEFAGNTRSMLGMQAIQQGNIKEGVKLLTDAYEQNVPDGKSVEATINPDGSVNVAVGYKRAGPDGKISLSPIEERTVPLKDLPQYAAYITDAGKRAGIGIGATANAKRSGGGGGGAVGGETPASTRKAVAEYESAAKALRALPADATEEQRDAAYQNAMGAYRTAVDSFQVGKNKSKAYAAQQYGVQLPQRGGATAPATRPSTGRTSAGTAEQRAEAMAEAERARLDKFDQQIGATKQAVDADTPYPGAIQEVEQNDLVREKQTIVKRAELKRDFDRIAMGAKANPAETMKFKERKEAYDAIVESTSGILAEQFNLPDAETKDPKKASLTKDQRTTIADAAFDIARRNDLTQDQASRAAISLLRGSLRPDENGMIQAGQFKVAMDVPTVRAIAAIRGPIKDNAEKAATPTKPEPSAINDAARAAAGAAKNALTPTTPRQSPVGPPSTQGQIQDYGKAGREAVGGFGPFTIPKVGAGALERIGRDALRKYGYPTE
jgi:hypothetical protein